MDTLRKVEDVWKKNCVYDELQGERDTHIYTGDLVVCLGILSGHVGGFDGVHGGYGVGQGNLEGRMLFELCLEKELCVSNTWLKRVGKRKVTHCVKMSQKLNLC